MNSRTPRRSFAGLRAAGVLILSMIAVLATPPGADAQDLTSLERQRLAHQVRPATVLVHFSVETEVVLPGTEGPVTLKTSIAGGGSGWVVTPDGFIVTNGHVVELFHHANDDLVKRQLLTKALTEAGHFTQLGSSRGSALSEAEQKSEADQLFEVATFTVVGQLKIVMQNGQVYDAEVRQYSGPIQQIAGNASITNTLSFTSGKDVAIIKIPGRDLPTLELADSETVRVGEEVFVAGFPGVVLNTSALGAARQLEASVLPGSIAAVRVSVEGSDLLQLDAQIGSGNSGGPVVGGRAQVLGIATLAAADARAGASFGFAVPATTIRDFIRAEGITPSESMFNRTWSRALDAYYGEDYAAAVPAFDEVLRVMPDLPDALELRRESMTLRDDPNAVRSEPEEVTAPVATVPATEPASGGMPSWLLPVLALGVLLVGGGLMMRKSPAPATAGASASSPASAAATAVAPVAAPAATSASLVVVGGSLKGNRFDIEAGGLTIGRDPSVCQIVLSESAISREHAVIRMDGSSLTIKNLSGTNPTYVNDRAIQEAGLKKGDKVKVGESTFAVEIA